MFLSSSDAILVIILHFFVIFVAVVDLKYIQVIWRLDLANRYTTLNILRVLLPVFSLVSAYI